MANMGDPNASIPTPQPTFYRPQIAAHGRARHATSVTFISQAALTTGELPVLQVTLIPRAAPVARLGWTIGNLHFPIQVEDTCIRVPDNPAMRQLFEREKISFIEKMHINRPFARAHAYGSPPLA